MRQLHKDLAYWSQKYAAKDVTYNFWRVSSVDRLTGGTLFTYSTQPSREIDVLRKCQSVAQLIISRDH